MRTNRSKQSGLTLIEVLIAASILTVGLLAVSTLSMNALWQVTQSRQRSIARLAAITCHEALANQQFRKLNPTDTTYFLYGKGPTSTATYPIAWNWDGTAFQMPDCTSVAFGGNYAVTGSGSAPGLPANTYKYAANVTDGSPAVTVSNCVCVEFPVPGLIGLAGRAPNTPSTVTPCAGRITFYLSEAGQPVQNAGTIPPAAFPFPPSPGLTKLDCDGDRALTTTDLRAAGDQTAANPFKLIPVKIAIDWKAEPTASSYEEYATYFILCYRGYD